MTRLEDKGDLTALLTFFRALIRVSSAEETPRYDYAGSDPLVEKAYRIIRLLRRDAARLTPMQGNFSLYLLPMLQWTLPIVSFRDVPLLRKRLAMYCAGLICQRLG